MMMEELYRAGFETPEQYGVRQPEALADARGSEGIMEMDAA
jgi:hypothetical protein